MDHIIYVPNGLDAQLVYSSLEDYLAVLLKDLRTKYGNSPNYCKEDDDFLRDAIDRVVLILGSLYRQHPNIVQKG